MLFVCLFFSGFYAHAQTMDTIQRKAITISKITEVPQIDGVLDDEAWKNAAIADGFVERQPVNGRPIPDSLKTEVKIVYDDLGIYFGATMYDPQPLEILKELTERDQIGNDDFFYILLNGYNDRQQSLQFIVTAAGVQYDAKMT
ncbi:MAG: carbohydrate binding family 9 domain-containing protein, partial [Flavobacteriales bacterium]|nr:carbohydrate binding family 9 domain-containing protein [Flavobacteriales bacterium]